MLNPKMKNHPPFVLTRLSSMQRSQHTKLLRKNKDSPRPRISLAVRKDSQKLQKHTDTRLDLVICNCVCPAVCKVILRNTTYQCTHNRSTQLMQSAKTYYNRRSHFYLLLSVVCATSKHVRFDDMKSTSNPTDENEESLVCCGSQQTKDSSFSCAVRKRLQRCFLQRANTRLDFVHCNCVYLAVRKDIQRNTSYHCARNILKDHGLRGPQSYTHNTNDREMVVYCLRVLTVTFPEFIIPHIFTDLLIVS